MNYIIIKPFKWLVYHLIFLSITLKIKKRVYVFVKQMHLNTFLSNK